MPYAAVTDMVAWFGATEMIQLTTPQGQPMEGIISAPILTALTTSSDVIDSYVSRRYQTPIAVSPLPPSIVRACCILARFDLANGDGRVPSEEMRLARKETVGWLEKIASGHVVLPLDNAPAVDESFAMMSDRGATFGPGPFKSQSYPTTGNGPSYPTSDQGGDW